MRGSHAMTDRRWTATVTVDGVTLDADLPEQDLMRETRDAAAAQAALLADGEHAEVTMFKTTKAHGTRQERTYSVFTYRGRTHIQ